MPAKIWEVGEEGLHSRVHSDWEAALTPEQFRGEAEELDRELDAILDRAIDRVAKESTHASSADFVRAWAVGRCLNESQVLDSTAMKRERPSLLWKALASKCRTGARSDGTVEERWRQLRPQRAGEPRREGGRLDYFEMCRWLAGQDLADAVHTFGALVRNVWQMLERPTLRPLIVRRALLGSLGELPEEDRQRLYDRRTFAELMKTLRRRWPDRGPGSAKRPIHYSEAALQAEIGCALRESRLPLQAPS
jgi:hypothetical protein